MAAAAILKNPTRPEVACRKSDTASSLIFLLPVWPEMAAGAFRWPIFARNMRIT